MTTSTARGLAYKARWGKPQEETLPGEVMCLMCKKPFQSPHRVKVRVCMECKETDLWKSSRGTLA